MAENTVDNLDIEISADADAAIKEIKRLTSHLQGLEKYSETIEILSKSSYVALDEAARAAKEFSAEVRNAVRSLDDLVVEGKTFAGIISNAIKPKGIINAGEEAKKATIDLRAFGEAMKQAKNYQEAYNIAREHGVPIKTAAEFAQKHFPSKKESSTDGDSDARKQYEEWYRRVLALSKQVKEEQAKAAAEAKRFREQCEAQSKSLSKTASSADILRLKIDGLQGKLANALETGASSDRIGSYVAQIQRLEKELEDLENSSSAVERNTKKTSSAFKDLANSARGFVKLGISKAANSFKNSFAGINKQLNYFGAAIKSVLVYSTLSRMLGAITKGVQTGTENLYQYSKIIDGKFAASMDRLAASFQYFQNSIGAAIAPIINAFAPAIDLAVDKVVELINAFNQMIAKLTGASSWTKAVKVPKEYAEAADKASKANKNLLASFDELNVIQSKDSGSGKTVPDYGSMFEEVPLDGYSLPDFVQQIKDKINEGDWRGVGETLGEKVNEITSSINWAAAGENLGKGLQDIIDTYNGFMETVDWSGIGSGLGDALNNLMANVDFQSAGAAFAQGWNALVELIHGFVTTTDWKSVGLSIAGFINGWFDTVDWSLLGQTVSDGVKSLLEALRTAVQETDWKSIGSNISEMLNQIEWSSLFSESAGLISDTVKGLLDLMIGAVQTLEWDKLGEELVNSVVGAVTSIEFTDIVDKFFELWGSALAADRKFTVAFWKTIGGKLIEGFKGVFDNFGENIKKFGGDIGDYIMLGLLNVWNGIGEWIYQHIFQPFINGFKNVFGINSPSTVMAEMGGYLVEGLLSGLKNTWNTVTAWFTDSVSWVKTKLTGGFTDIKNSVVKIWNDLWGGVKGVINSMLGGVEKMANGIVKGINKMIGALNGLSFDVPDWVPGIGGETFGFNIREISEVKIPRLASGGVITSPTFAQIGEYPGAASNPEIVAPQSVIYDTVVSANGEQERLLREQNSLLRQLLAKESNIVLAPSAALGRVNRKSEKMIAALAGG